MVESIFDNSINTFIILMSSSKWHIFTAILPILFYDFLRQDNVYDLLLFIILFILSQQDRKKRTLAQNCDVS